MISREELYELVWSKPMTKVAEQFDVSGSYMARVCSVMRVPRPERGYWAKLAVGKAQPKQVLPEALPGDQLYWSNDGNLPVTALPKPAVPPKQRTPRIPRAITGSHALVRGVKSLFEASRNIDEGAYLKPYKRLLVDVTCSKVGLDKALAFANELFNALEGAGFHVMIAPQSESSRRGRIEEQEEPKKRHDYYESRLWSPQRPTIVYVGTVAIGLALIEMSESVLMRYVKGKYIRDADYVPPKASRYHDDHTWTTTRELPSGRFRLVAYSPYWQASWSANWQETKNSALSREIPKIVKTIEDGASELVKLLEEAARQAEIDRIKRMEEAERRRQEEDKRRIQQSIKESKSHLGEIIQSWGGVITVEHFLENVEGRAKLLPADESQRVMERLKLARDFLGTQNPLDFFMAWKTPSERYQPLASRSPESSQETDDEDDEDEDDLDDLEAW